MNSTKTSVRNELFSQATLVSAIRLPNNLFTDNAGTEVGSDLIVLQKNLSKKEMSQGIGSESRSRRLRSVLLQLRG